MARYPTGLLEEELKNKVAGLKAGMKKLAAKIEPKVYEYGFLRK